MLRLSFLPFVMSKYRIRVSTGDGVQLAGYSHGDPQVAGGLPKIVEHYEERIWAESEPGGRLALLCAIPLGKGMKR